MTYDPETHHRRSIRLRGYDYTQPGAYYVTICIKDRTFLLGNVVDGEMRLSVCGEIAAECWREIPRHFVGVELDTYVVMPNHVHGIVVITVGARHAVPLHDQPLPAVPDDERPPAVPLHDQRPPAVPLPTYIERFGQPVQGSLPTIIRSFKSATTKRINEIRSTPGAPVWQRNYYERIIRNEEELCRVREYILNNFTSWALDQENPDHMR